MGSGGRDRRNTRTAATAPTNYSPSSSEQADSDIIGIGGKYPGESGYSWAWGFSQGYDLGMSLCVAPHHDSCTFDSLIESARCSRTAFRW